MIEDWPSEIVRTVIVRQHLEAVDTLFEYPLPEVATEEAHLVAVERSIGALDPQYRTFLTYANGWRKFWHNVDLFGTQQLLGAPPMKSAEEGIADIGDISEHTGFDLADLQVIGASDVQTDLWLIGPPGSPRSGRVLWFWGSDYEDYPDFGEFFLAMVDYGRLDLQRLTEGQS